MTEQQPPEPPEEQPGQPQQPGPPWGQPQQGGQPAWGQQPSPGQQPAWGQQPGGQPGQPGSPGWGTPPGPGAYGPSGYGPPAYGQPWGAPQTSGRATTVLVLGIVSVVVLFTCGLGFIPAIIALVLAPGASREIAESGGRLTGDSQVRTGRILSWVTIGISALLVVIFAVLIGVAISVDDGASGTSRPAVVSPG